MKLKYNLIASFILAVLFAGMLNHDPAVRIACFILFGLVGREFYLVNKSSISVTSHS